MNQTAFIGFDGYIDHILNPISSVSQTHTSHFFQTIHDFGSYIQSKSGKSCSIQLSPRSTQLGGNAPLFARTLKSLGISIYLAGMLGHPDIAPVFLESFSKEELCSFAPPMETNALEFNDGKIMLCQTAPAYDSPIQRIQTAALHGNLSLPELLNSDLLAFLNWGELYFMHTLWTELFQTYFKKPKVISSHSKYIFFDPADISSRNENELSEMLELIKSYSLHRYAILSINENEALQLGNKLFNLHSVDTIIHELYKNYSIPEIVIHANKRTLSLVNHTEYELPTSFVDKPAISTGGGDNFNAGYAYAKLCSYDPIKCIKSAHLSSSFYISSGTPISRDVFLSLMQQ